MKKKIFSILLCLFWMYIIFYNSSQTGEESNIFSKKVLDKIKEYIKKEDINDTGNNINKVLVDNNTFVISNTIQVNNISLSNKKQYNNVSNLKVVEPTKSVYSNFKEQLRIDNSNIFLRKNAHALEFLILAILLGLVFKSFGMSVKNSIVYILFVVLLYAVTDEYHQIFVEGRDSRVFDIIVDFIGGCIGTIIFCILCFFRSAIKKAIHKKDKVKKI